MDSQEYERAMKLKEQSEKLFREKCDENDYTYMYIDQEKMTFSSKLWKSLSKKTGLFIDNTHTGPFFKPQST